MRWTFAISPRTSSGTSGCAGPGCRRPALVWEVMGVQMEKPYHVRRSPWDSRQLSYDQLKYACADAFASFEVGRRHIGDHISRYI